MSELEQLLQERIERLESGESLSVCLAGLPAPEARALRLIATIQAMAMADIGAESVAEQRSVLLGTAVTRLKPTAAPPSPATPLFLVQLQSWFDWLLSRPELAGALAFILLIALLGVAWLGSSRRQAANEHEAIIATLVEPTIETIAEEAPPASPVAEETEEGQATPLGEAVPTTAVIVATHPAYTAYLPVLSSALNLNAQTAAVQAVAGLVEVQGADGVWTAVNRTSTITAGQRIRTSKLSQATLIFFDGSEARLHANTEISIDQLNAQRPETGPRAIVMTQHLGESDHSVEFRDDGSHYEVNTPAGFGIARGTKFQVLVTAGLLSRFAVTEGKVDVTGLSQTVSVVAGQTTAVLAGSPPQTPAFRISGEGEISQIGPIWMIGGQTFQTHDQTVIIGNPQVGDLVYVEGHLLADGGRMADRIILLRPPLNNRFTLTGHVEAIELATWTVAGQTILINEQTEIDEDITSGDRVRVTGVILAGGSLLAHEIEKMDDLSGFPFRFTGIVQDIQADTWVISGQTITVNEATHIDDDIIIGDVVKVRGWILDDGTWLARRIERVEEELPTFSFNGRVQSIDPWQVAGIAFETRDWTVIEPGTEVDDRVRVRGVILEDGTWVASTIEKIRDDDDNNIIILVGVVNSIDPWVVNGLQLFVTEDTVISDGISLGDLVLVRIRILEDGTWRVLRIRPLYPHFGLGCFIINTLVIGLESNQLALQNWPALTLNEDMVIEGNIQSNSVITFRICIRFDRTIIIIGHIIVIYQPIIIVVPPAPPPPAPQPPGGGGDNRNGNDNG